MIVLLLVGLFIGYAVHVVVPSVQLEDKVRELETKITNLQTQIDQLKAQIAEREEELAEKDETIESLTGQIEELKAELEQISETRILGVYFSPKGKCEEQTIYWIGRANSTIHILIYSFTLDSIGEALITAHHRGVEVMVVFEESQITEYSEYQTLRAAGVPVRNDTNSKLMHHKVIIVDGIIVLTGSFNWSKSAQEYNNENLVIVRSTYVAAIYEEEFQKIWVESV